MKQSLSLEFLRSVSLLREVVTDELEKRCEGVCAHALYDPHSTKECLETRIVAFLKSIDE